MHDETIIGTSRVGQRLDAIKENEEVAYLMFNNSKIQIVSKITIGRARDNNVVIDSNLASRYHAFIQKIKDDFYIKDMNSTNGTMVNGKKIPSDKYVKLNPSDTISIGKTNLSIA
ncbi:MAG: FHA domain-containing protein [Treponema sp.]|jgi:pSer/pThr/pTyr-binding forkhead associated (FHA) protein|nr:FHA domain-containing protein [Treponema sp.]